MMEAIRQNIAASGQHITLVAQSNVPRFAYTIGLYPILGAELLMPGAIIFDADSLCEILNEISSHLKAYPQERAVNTDKFGRFHLVESHPSWVEEFLLGVFDYFETPVVTALQVVPDPEHFTLDVPDTSLPWSPSEQPVWRWLKEPWIWPVPEDSSAVTNLAALRGAAVTEASRWGIDEWELFAGSGPDTPEEELRVVPIATLVGPDPSLFKVLSVDVGKSLWRESREDPWHDW
jgi:hypothetical protein